MNAPRPDDEVELPPVGKFYTFSPLSSAFSMHKQLFDRPFFLVQIRKFVLGGAGLGYHYIGDIILGEQLFRSVTLDWGTECRIVEHKWAEKGNELGID